MTSFSDTTLRDFLRLAASDAPAPGGGGVAALAGCLGAAMASMAVNFTVGKAKFAEHDAALRPILIRQGELLDALRDAIDADARAFTAIADAYKLPKATDDEKAARRAAIDAALDASMRVPLGVLMAANDLAATLTEVARRANPNLLSDVMVAAIMCTACAKAALVNIYANSRSLTTDTAREAEAGGEAIAAAVEAVEAEVRAAIAQRS